MRVQYIHDGSTAEISLTAETEAEMLMLGTLERDAWGLQAKLMIEHHGHVSNHRIRCARVLITQEPPPKMATEGNAGLPSEKP
jgi:thiamine biosynthesis protein ThiC